MRWRSHYFGEVRIITKFLWLPKRINENVRWLETVKIEQIYAFNWLGNLWYDLRFVDY